MKSGRLCFLGTLLVLLFLLLLRGWLDRIALAHGRQDSLNPVLILVARGLDICLVQLFLLGLLDNGRNVLFGIVCRVNKLPHLPELAVDGRDKLDQRRVLLQRQRDALNALAIEVRDCFRSLEAYFLARQLFSVFFIVLSDVNQAYVLELRNTDPAFVGQLQGVRY